MILKTAMLRHDYAKPIAVQVRGVQELINRIIQHQSIHKTLLICSSREEFHREMLAATSSISDEGETMTDRGEDSQNRLLIPTLHLIATTAKVKLIFAPTLAHLRAYLSVHQLSQTQQATITHKQTSSQVPVLAIWGLVCLHRSTTEHSAQGLSRTLSAAAEVACHASQRLILVESRIPEIYEGGESAEEIVHCPWKELIPLLSGSVRISGDQRTFAGRRIEVGDVMAKWCSFEQESAEEVIL